MCFHTLSNSLFIALTPYNDCNIATPVAIDMFFILLELSTISADNFCLAVYMCS